MGNAGGENLWQMASIYHVSIWLLSSNSALSYKFFEGKVFCLSSQICTVKAGER